jgi:hypothetical protein
MTADISTKAKARARALAGRLEQAGFNVKVTVERTDAQFFSSGETMLPARVLVSVSALGPSYRDNSYGFTFSTSLPARGTARPPSSWAATSTGVSTRAAASRAGSSP